jgi:hypothetical protein
MVISLTIDPVFFFLQKTDLMGFMIPISNCRNKKGEKDATIGELYILFRHVCMLDTNGTWWKMASSCAGEN